ncbi:HAD family hydrolase [Robertkochia solimangrovi]|uniref:HAD family hydrolase n=1 Tax=Robertkochia solimangrovi TaxID=2213046 RepID=UPI00117F79CA|nr:HAD family hydrolase [Robertkochia solimangrovi]TRZ45032.1 haloacid dehalogenase-like hydrolase [Robertkochia solimangrovi]
MFLKQFILALFLVFTLGCKESVKTDTIAQETQGQEMVDPLPSWNEGAAKSAIIDFVTKTTTNGSSDFVPEKDRIACFDNDGTLWTEQPLYFQFIFAIDRIKAMAPDHPEWKSEQPFKAIMEGDMETVLAGGMKSVLSILGTTHAGMTTDEFNKTVADWIATATHPKTGKHYDEMIFKPMLELLDYLRDHGYKTFIVSGGGIDFIRVWAEEAYGIPPDQVVGSSGKVTYEVKEDGTPVLIKQPELNFIDDKEGKPVGIHQYIGKRPIFTAGNSDGDYQMLQYTSTATGYPRFGLIVHHTDGEREYAYDRESHIGELDQALDDAEKYGWIIIDMKSDWNTIYP